MPTRLTKGSRRTSLPGELFSSPHSPLARRHQDVTNTFSRLKLTGYQFLDSLRLRGGTFVSIIRVGLSETKNFSEGYDAIFSKKKASQARKSEASAKSVTGKKKKKGKKK